MKDNNDELVARFLQSRCKEIEDNGFSERVIRNLPKRRLDISRILNFICFAICAFLFIKFDGFIIIFEFVSELFAAKSHILSQDINYNSLFIAFGVLLCIGIERICSLKW